MSLSRFVQAQQTTYLQALSELRDGHKTSHWMWYIFPQLADLGQSDTARFYGIAGSDEAHAYLAHVVLGARLAECTEALMTWATQREIASVLGTVDAVKLRSAMTLFEAVGASFAAPPLEAFYNGKRDERTLALLRKE